MKKLLSLILAITMIAALIPAAFAADEEATTVTYTYAFTNGSWLERGNTSTQARTLKNNVFATETLTDTEWAYLGSGTSENVGYTNTSNLYNMVVGNFGPSTKKDTTRAVAGAAGEWLAFKVEVPVSGKYTVDVKSYLYTYATNDMDVYLLPSQTRVQVGGYIGALEGAFADSRVYGQYVGDASTTCTRENAKKFSEFSFESIDPDDYKAIDSANTYKNLSTNNAFAEGVQNIAGTATKELSLDAGVYVLLLCTNDDKGNAININSLTLTKQEDEPTNAPTELTGNITFGSGAAIEYKKTNDAVFKTLSANGVDSTSFVAGDSVTVKVTNTENFAGWVRGTANSGVWVSSAPEYTFNIMSPTYLTPVYTTPEENATHSVEFWDENGAYVETITATDGKAVLPTSGYGLVGGEFSGWWINATTQLLANDEVAEGITRAVAKYNYGTFGTKVENNNNTATYWKRGDDIVAYGTSYDFYQWNGTPTITFGTEEITQNPLVLLDSTPVDGAYMIEYDKGNASEIVEAGILFGSQADIHIGSTDGSKAASQRNGVDDGINDGHGQFCAKPNKNGAHAYARGYLIYRGTDEKLYVIYTAAVATTSVQ